MITKEKKDKAAKGRANYVETDLLAYTKKALTIYGLETNLERAVPDFRDGLKPVQRRILWSAHQNAPKGSKTVKTAKVVGHVLGNYHPHGDCLRGNTLIPFLDGTFRQIKDMVGKGSKWVLAYDAAQEKYVPAKAYGWRVGQSTKKLLRIRLSDGSTLEVTKDHPLYVENKGWVKAKHLNRFDFVEGGLVDTSRDYRVLKSNTQVAAVHRIVGEETIRALKTGENTHHVNECRADNRPFNLEIKTNAEHALEHGDYLIGLSNGRDTMFNGTKAYRRDIRRKNSELLTAYNKVAPIVKAVKIVKLILDKGLKVTEDIYNTHRTSIYKGTTLATALDYGFDLDDLKNLAISGASLVDTSKAVGFTKNLPKVEKSASDVGPGLSGFVVDSSALLKQFVDVIRFGSFEGSINLNDFSWDDYQETRQDFSSIGFIKMSPKEDTIKCKFGLDWKGLLRLASPRFCLFVESVTEVGLKSKEDFYDFTVDDYENMIVATKKRKGQFTFAVVHNSAVVGAIETMVNCSEALLEGQGNWGNVSAPAAAMRYTELRMNGYSNLMMLPDYLAVATMVPNYSRTEQEPLFLPSLVPNLLVNGTAGIGVGVTSKIPSFTLASVLKACLHVIESKSAEPKDLVNILKFSTKWGGYYSNTKTNKANFLSLLKEDNGKVTFESNLVVNREKKTILVNGFAPNLPVKKAMEELKFFHGVKAVYNDTGREGVQYIMIAQDKLTPEEFEKLERRVRTYLSRTESYRINVTERGLDEYGNNDIKFFALSIPALIVRWLKWRVQLELTSLKERHRKQLEKIERVKLLIFAADKLDIIFKALRQRETKAYLVSALKISPDDAQTILEFRVRQLSALDKVEQEKNLKELQAHAKELQDWIRQPLVRVKKQLLAITAKTVSQK